MKYLSEKQENSVFSGTEDNSKLKSKLTLNALNGGVTISFSYFYKAFRILAVQDGDCLLLLFTQQPSNFSPNSGLDFWPLPELDYHNNSN